MYMNVHLHVCACTCTCIVHVQFDMCGFFFLLGVFNLYMSFLKVFLTGENLASIPGLIGSNFTEKEFYAMTILEHYSIPKDQETPRRLTLDAQIETPVYKEEKFDPFLKFVILEWDWKIQNSEGIGNLNMATVELSNSSLTVGKISISSSNEETEEGIAVRLSVEDISGVEGEDTDSRQK